MLHAEYIIIIEDLFDPGLNTREKKKTILFLVTLNILYQIRNIKYFLPLVIWLRHGHMRKFAQESKGEMDGRLYGLVLDACYLVR
jgi:hypothetical protein